MSYKQKVKKSVERYVRVMKSQGKTKEEIKEAVKSIFPEFATKFEFD